MTFAEAQAFLAARTKWGMRPGTGRIAALVEALGHPPRSYPVLHVAGTNGKFSVVQMCSSILGALGLTVGTMTSPHLEHVTERVTVGGEPIAEEDFGGALGYLEPYISIVEEANDDTLTVFELLTAIGYEWLFDRGVHVAVVECGLGGEYDATNVADGTVAVVTNVTADHLDTFGDLRTAAWEKAGIVKEGATLVSGVGEPWRAVVEERARERGAEATWWLDSDVVIEQRQVALGGQLIRLRTPNTTYVDLLVPAYGAHQAANAALAVAAAEAFAGEALEDDGLRAGLEAAYLPGRLEVVGRRPLVVLEGGHNPAGAAVVRDSVRESFTYEQLWLVLGMLDDKAVEDVVGTIAGIADHFVVCRPSDDRGAPTARLRAALVSAGVDPSRVESVDGVADALAYAIGAARADDLVLVFGSLYTVGEARSWLRAQGAVPQR